jgi:hypothetical protein
MMGGGVPNRGMNDSPSRVGFMPPNNGMMPMGMGSMYGPMPGFMQGQDMDSASRRGSGAGFPIPNRGGLPSDEQIIADIQAGQFCPSPSSSPLKKEKKQLTIPGVFPSTLFYSFGSSRS